MEFPRMVNGLNGDDMLKSNNFMDQRRCIDCVFSIAHALICKMRGVKRGEDVKLRAIVVTDCHNEYNDWFSVEIGLSRSGYATEYTTFIVPSDTEKMSTVFEELFKNYATTEETVDNDTKLKGIYLHLQGIGKTFLRDFGKYIQLLQDMLDSEEIITPYAYINRFGIPADSFRQMKEEFEELVQRYC